ncbi:argininosuccinate synthase [Oculatella sp. LEGE 06141]|uniref:argininosuccinate synthase n=1 Tax=Oculatella sp. LEGE 06141 TaxID=1828648 RepID=UPI001881DA49|nr:argininosuccinate synthase [Oculatella sp. LEGE 06141]MBE9177098.1 argininosuccinate synthase [Oculatella sp. LEGE 06141]
MKAQDLKGKTVAFAGSGGLDSCTITRWLTDKGIQVVCFTADLGQPDEDDTEAIRQRMLMAGATDFVLLPAREAIAEAGLSVIQSQACYEGRYWNTTGIARCVLTEAMVREMRKRGLTIFSHGATGRGNDQVRFQLITNMLAPDFDVYAPWRDEEFLARFPGRSEMIDFCQEKGLSISATKDKPYSTDANLLGLTHESGLLESLTTPAHFVTPVMGCYPADAANEPEEVTIQFEKGRPVAVNGKSVNLVDAILQTNAIGGRHGIGIGTHLVENRFVGIKSRGVYESPGVELLGTCYALLLQLILDRRAREFYDQLSLLVAKQIYQGYWFDLATKMALQAIQQTAELTTGTIAVSLYKGNISFLSATDTPHSLYSEENASMEGVGDYNHSDSEGLLRVFGVSARALATSGQVSLKAEA